MIFYTLKGPKYNLEIHDDKIKLVGKNYWKIMTPRNAIMEWKLTELSHFQISSPKVLWGKLEWSSFEGDRGEFHFSTNSEMVGKIEKYLHKLIIKNLNRKSPTTTKTEKEYIHEQAAPAAA